MAIQVIYLSYDGMTDPLGQSQVLPYLCELTKLGFSFTIISCEKPDLFKTNRQIIEKQLSDYKIEWYPLKYTKSPPILSTVIDLTAMRKKAIGLHKKKSFSIVHCRGHLPSLVGLYLKRRYKLKFLFDMRGFWPDEKVDAGAWNLKNAVFYVVYKYFKKMEREFIKEADHITCLTQNGLREMLSWEHALLRKESITVIPCCVDTGLFNPFALSEDKQKILRMELGIDSKECILSYLGSIGTWYMLEEMLDFFNCFRSKVPDAKFLFITHSEQNKIMAAARERGIEHLILIRPARRSEVPDLLSLSRFSIFFIRPTYSKISSSPTKQAEIMAMGIPVICNAGVGDTDAIVSKHHSGIVIGEFNFDTYQNSISTLLKSSFKPSNIREGALKFFSLSAGVQKYKIIYTEILK